MQRGEKTFEATVKRSFSLRAGEQLKLSRATKEKINIGTQHIHNSGHININYTQCNNSLCNIHVDITIFYRSLLQVQQKSYF